MKKKMQEIIDKLNKAADAYYNGKNELMSDHEWDALFDKLKKMEEESGIVLPDSPTNNVSADTTPGKKEKHEHLALSLAKTKKIEDLVKWAEGKPIWMSWKLDGLTLVVTYDGGKLSKVVTRGDGHIGTNITHLAEGITGILKKIDYKGHLVIRGEAVISYKDFESFNLESEETYANPRNLASGSLTLKDVNELKRRNLTWIPFTLVHADKELNTWGKQMEFLEKQGFKCVEHKLISISTKENIEKSVNEFSKKVETLQNIYPVDGLVIVYDDAKYAKTGSVTGHHATKGGYAFKWKDESSVSKLIEIEWSCATCAITPVAIFEPVELEGTTVQRASLCNLSELERLKIGGKGSEVEVIKANKIIPKIIAVNKQVGKVVIPKKCPVCNSLTKITKSDTGTKVLKCSNQLCPAKQLKKYSRFVSKQALDIDGISQQTLQKFIQQGWINNYGDIFRLNKHKDEISKMEGFGKKSSDNIMNAIEKSRNTDEYKVLFGLSIEMAGIDVCKKLLNEYSLEELMNISVSSKDYEYFSIIDGIGPEKSSSFIKWFKNKENVKNLKDVIKELNIKRYKTNIKDNKLSNLVFVITGDVHKYKNRDELKKEIESLGGKVTGSVTSKTSYLINNDISSTSSKNKKAKELGIKIITEDEYIKMTK